jgi:adenylate cyclase
MQRLAAIFAADVAGYSRLMAAGERATVASLDAARSVFKSGIESNQGRVIDMAGDSVLAVFETASGAVSAALSVQQELNASSSALPEDRRMRFRIGVHLGDVIEKADGTVYGDGVNIAARLEGLAEPGGITVSESIRTAVKGKVSATFEDQGEQTVKNIAEPVRAYRVGTGGGAASRPTLAVGEIDPSRRGPSRASPRVGTQGLQSERIRAGIISSACHRPDVA